MSKKLVIITGDARGIGQGIKSYLSEEGFEVIGLDILNEKPCDISREEDIIGIAKSIRSSGKKVYAIIHNAAIQIEKRAEETSLNELEKLFSINLYPVFLFVKHFKDLLEKDSSILNMSSVHARATSGSIAAYAASKGALSALTRALAIELGPEGIRVNAICPGAIDTEMLRKGLSRSGDPAHALKKLENSSPLKRIGAVKDIANLVRFLIDHEKAANITGQEFICDSGVLSKLPSE